MRATASDVLRLDARLLRRWPLPRPADDGDKEERGRILVIGGSRAMPGAIMLAAEAAIRAGAGKLSIAAGRSIARLVAVAIPESRVITVAETVRGGFSPASARALKVDGAFDAMLIGPGMEDEAATRSFAAAILPRLGSTPVVLDARAMAIAREKTSGRRASIRFEQPVILTPHIGEMAHLTGVDKDQISKMPLEAARAAAQRWNAVVALKGATTFIASPDGRAWKHEGGNIGLAVSGSGDTLAGIIAGLVARGAALEQATAWGVWLHARAGERLARRYGSLGYLARELAAEIPALMAATGR